MAEPIFDSSILKECLRRWQNGDENAPNELVKLVQTRLEKLARRMFLTFPNVRSHTDSEDILQNSFLRLLPSLKRLKPSTTREFYGLASLQIRRVLLDVARAHGGKAANTVSVDWTRPPEHIEPMALQDFDPERWILFHEAVDRLPIEEREVVGLRFYHGWKQKHIAELFQVDVRTVRRRWSSAREKLQVLAGALFDDE